MSSILPEEVEEEVKAAAEISMGTDISEEDIENVTYLCDQIIQIAEYRMSLYDYLKNRMQAIAPNLTVMVGELVGARLVAHAGMILFIYMLLFSCLKIFNYMVAYDNLTQQFTKKGICQPKENLDIFCEIFHKVVLMLIFRITFESCKTSSFDSPNSWCRKSTLQVKMKKSNTNFKRFSTIFLAINSLFALD